MAERRIIPWGGMGVIIPLLIGVAFAVLTFSDLDSYDALIAKLCFVFACVVGGIQALLLAARRRGRMSYAVAFFACGVIGVLGLALVNYVNHKQESRTKASFVATPNVEPLISASSSPASSSPSPARNSKSPEDGREAVTTPVRQTMPSVKSTAPPPITQPPATQAEEPPKPIEKLGVSVEEISSENENLPYGLSVIISTTVVISPVNMEVVCSGPIGSARVSFSPPPGASAFASNMFGLGRQIDGNILRFSFAGPPFTPRGPLEVKVFSAHKIRVLMVKRLD